MHVWPDAAKMPEILATSSCRPPGRHDDMAATVAPYALISRRILTDIKPVQALPSRIVSWRSVHEVTIGIESDQPVLTCAFARKTRQLYKSNLPWRGSLIFPARRDREAASARGSDGRNAAGHIFRRAS